MEIQSLTLKGSVAAALLLTIALISVDACAAVSEWVPFENEGGHIVIPVTVNGEKTSALLDSGAELHGISERFLSRHKGQYTRGRPIRLSGIAGTRKTNFINGLKVGVFGAEFEVNKMAPMLNSDIDVIIGLSFFNNFIFQIDYPNSKLRLISHDTLDLKKLANVRMKKAANSTLPIVKVNMNGQASVWLALDTGNNGGILLPRRSAKRFEWLENYTTTDSRIAGVNEVADVEQFNLPEFTIGPVVLENVLVIVPNEGQRTNFATDAGAKFGTRIKGTSTDGILGYDVLKHFIVTIDYKRSFLHLGVPAETESL